MATQGGVLLLGDDEPQLRERAARLRELGFRTTRAKTAYDALLLAQERGQRFRVVLLDAGLPVMDLRSALEALRRRASDGRMELLATGARPEADALDGLRDAGVERALWDPASDHLLRFEVNRALADAAARRPRGELRAATDWQTRIFVSGRAKRGAIYTFSAGGTFVSTARPSMRGARLSVDLPLPSGQVQLAGRVVYANVPGNLRRETLPLGMAIRFEETTREQQQLLREAAEACSARVLL